MTDRWIPVPHKEGVTIIIPTLNGGDVFAECLKKIRAQNFHGKIQLLVVDSGSTDDTLRYAEQAGAQVINIPPSDFHHARTRNFALSHAFYEHVVFMVQDALPVSEKWLSGLKKAITSNPVEAVHVQQRPHDDADAYAGAEMELIAEAWGNQPRIQNISSLQQFMELPYDEAYMTIRLDNVCAVYKTESLVKRPFPNLEFAEDLAWGYDTILSGGSILYRPDISVKHSHNRPPEYRMKREIVNSIVLAKIINRVREDLSYISLMDLILLSAHFQDYTRSFFYCSIPPEASRVEKQQPFQNIVDSVFERYSIKNQLKRLLAVGFRKRKEIADLRLAGVLNNMKAHMKYEFSLIKDRKVTLSTEQTGSIVNIIAARILGRLYGETYAGKMLNNSLDHDFENFIRPFRGGV